MEEYTYPRGGILELLLVNAEGIRHTNIVGTPTYYVIIECGDQLHRSKLSSGEDGKAWWNEKFRFEFSISDWKSLTHLKLKIMDQELFSSDKGFVGETIIHIGGIITEGSDTQLLEVKPAPYNVVLEDDTYRGELKIGFKFITYKEEHLQTTRECCAANVNEPRKSVCRSILINVCKFSWRRFFFFCNKNASTNNPRKIN
ncbi:elicitor-responsive protein 3 [Tripterygium wilfordii]|uniref:elicitor-responsive protein 3 n=1 Tax=Tripterygium wilfordii TaxID=458696 RepID=UPI0018F8066D|nr:elicitor-responsive protein 3 [Tripterygium wilfordii]